MPMGESGGAGSFQPSPLRQDPASVAMVTPRLPVPDPRAHLERCWREDCDLDPMILRLRLLRRRGAVPQARCLEQELLPLF